jgi:hypothetical protein
VCTNVTFAVNVIVPVRSAIAPIVASPPDTPPVGSLVIWQPSHDTEFT